MFPVRLAEYYVLFSPDTFRWAVLLFGIPLTTGLAVLLDKLGEVPLTAESVENSLHIVMQAIRGDLAGFSFDPGSYIVHKRMGSFCIPITYDQDTMSLVSASIQVHVHTSPAVSSMPSGTFFSLL